MHLTPVVVGSFERAGIGCAGRDGVTVDGAQLAGIGHQRGVRADVEATAVGRPGGDEMILIMSFDENERFAEKTIIHKIRQSLEGLVYWNDDTPFPIGASIGISRLYHLSENLSHQDTANKAEQMIGEADSKMYSDKEGKQARLTTLRDKALKGSSHGTPLPSEQKPS